MDFLKLKGHASLCWYFVELDRIKKGKDKIKTRDRIVTKLKDKFLPTDYMPNLYRKI